MSDDDHLDGHSIESLSDYLDRGREPRDPAIESSPAAQHALAALSRLRAMAPRVMSAQPERFEPDSPNWIERILDQIGVQARAGRDIPIAHDAPGAVLSISEGAVRALVREAGDRTDGLLVERIRLDGDVETADAPVELHVVVSTFDGLDQAVVTAEFSARVRDSLTLHTDLNITSITVRVHDSDLTDDESRS